MTYFYPASRAHHAYVMSLDFGMKFAKRDGFWTPEGLLTVTGVGGYWIEIAEESLHLLEPQDGDIGLIYDGNEASFHRGYWMIGDSHETKIFESIIFRKGKVFHWPEQAKVEAI